MKMNDCEYILVKDMNSLKCNIIEGFYIIGDVSKKKNRKKKMFQIRFERENIFKKMYKSKIK